ncbi:multifunctional CCA addition/repair protein [Magnetococcales bacterium HHB-1]
MPPLQAYIVGGFVRDHLLKRPAHDRDWVVVGESEERMLKRGFQQVGRQFPVFLHPETKEEYALARQERKTAVGHQGFSVEVKHIPLIEDLKRRDLTINAIAMDCEGHILDPLGGLQDLEQRVLRHVSDAFVEDPLRVLRVARFQAQLAPWRFTVALETYDLMEKITRSGELQSLSKERIWLELERALTTDYPWLFFEVLERCGALEVLFPELAALQGQTQPIDHHPEGDAWAHTLLALKQAVIISSDPVIRFAVLMHDLGKGATPSSRLPHHYGHEKVGEKMVVDFCKRLHIPKRYQSLASVSARYHLLAHQALNLRPGTVLKLLQGVGALRRPEVLEPFLMVVLADYRGRLGKESRTPIVSDFLRHCLKMCQEVDIQQLVARGKKGRLLGEMIRQEQILAIKKKQKLFYL